MKRAKFEGRMNEVMLVATKAAQNEDGTTDRSRSFLPFLPQMPQTICYIFNFNCSECSSKGVFSPASRGWKSSSRIAISW